MSQKYLIRIAELESQLCQKDQQLSLIEETEALLKQRKQGSDRYSGREDEPQVLRQLRQSLHRRPLPVYLPREIHRLESEESCCPECGGELDYLGGSLCRITGTGEQRPESDPHRMGKKSLYKT